MPIGKKWSQATAQHVKSNAPTESGIYELKAFGELVYIGKASNLRRRLYEHLNKRSPNFYRYETAGFLTSARSMEKDHLNRYGTTTTELPHWNDRDPRH